MKKLLMLMAMVALALSVHEMSAQDTVRPVKNKVAPEYPLLAKKMSVTGIVKLQVTIDSSGSVRSVAPVGGHPLLIESAIKAVKTWKFDPGPESSEVIQFRFTSQ